MRLRAVETGRENQAGDAGLLHRLAQRRVLHGLVLGLAMTTQLDPATDARVQGEQDVAPVVGQHDRRRGDVAGRVFAQAAARRRAEEGQKRLAQ